MEKKTPWIRVGVAVVLGGLGLPSAISARQQTEPQAPYEVITTTPASSESTISAIEKQSRFNLFDIIQEQASKTDERSRLRIFGQIDGIIVGQEAEDGSFSFGTLLASTAPLEVCSLNNPKGEEGFSLGNIEVDGEDYDLVIVQTNWLRENCPLSVVVLLNKSELADIVLRTAVDGNDYA